MTGVLLAINWDVCTSTDFRRWANKLPAERVWAECSDSLDMLHLLRCLGYEDGATLLQFASWCVQRAGLDKLKHDYSAELVAELHAETQPDAARAHDAARSARWAAVCVAGGRMHNRVLDILALQYDTIGSDAKAKRYADKARAAENAALCDKLRELVPWEVVEGLAAAYNPFRNTFTICGRELTDAAACAEFIGDAMPPMEAYRLLYGEGLEQTHKALPRTIGMSHEDSNQLMEAARQYALRTS